MKKKTFNIIIMFIIIFILVILGIYKCPFKYIFGISCPFCGITRAFLSAFSLDFKASFHYYFFWPLVLIMVIIHILYEFKVIKINKKIMYFFLYLFAIINLIYYFCRLFSGSDIVYFDFTESLIYRIYEFIIKIF